MKHWISLFLFFASLTGMHAQPEHYVHLEGNLNGKKIAMELIYREPSANNSDGGYFGSYYFLEDGKPFQGYIESMATPISKFLVNDRITDQSQTFTGTFNADGYIGTWTNGKDEFPFELRKKEPTTALLHFKNEKTYSNSDFPNIRSSTSYNFLVKNKDEKFSDMIYEKTYKTISIDHFIPTSKLQIDEFVKLRQVYFSDAKKGKLTEGDLNSAEASYSIYPTVNSKDYLVLCYAEYVIGERLFADNYNTFYNYSVRDQKWLEIRDVIDSSKWSQLETRINQKIKEFHKLPMDQSLSSGNPDLFIAEDAFAVENFILCKEGIIFVYFPNQLAFGFFDHYEIFITYKDLKDLLNKNFKP